MKKVILVILSFVVWSATSVGLANSISKVFNSETELSIKLSHTFVRVYVDGNWWIYEYDEDGKLVNVCPDDEF